MSRSYAFVPIVLSIAMGSCASNPDLPRLTVELAGTPVAEAFLVHGNCVAGWVLSVPLRIRADGRADNVAADSLDVRVEHAGTRALLGQDRVDLAHQALGPDSVLDVPVRLRLFDGAVDSPLPVVVSGALDASLPDFGTHVPYRLETIAQVFIPPPDGGGACSPPAP